MELKVVCNCGQKYKFDVEPVNQQMPFVVNCPVCGIDGTHLANGLLSQIPSAPVAIAPPPAAAPRLAPAPAPPPRAAAPSTHAATPAIPKYLQTNPATANNNFALGMLGALLGAALGVGLMIGFYMFAGFKFPLAGTLMGALIGVGARIMYKGTSSSLGGVCALLAFFTIAGTLFFMFGLIDIALSGFVTLVVGCAMAFKIASD
jgi:hypothetical protein